MTEVARRYDELRFDLLLTRESAGGTLPQETEARFAAELDACWRMMTEEEQEAVESSLGQQLPRSPQALRQVDRPVSPGEHALPRIPEAA